MSAIPAAIVAILEGQSAIQSATLAPQETQSSIVPLAAWRETVQSAQAKVPQRAQAIRASVVG